MREKKANEARPRLVGESEIGDISRPSEVLGKQNIRSIISCVHSWPVTVVVLHALGGRN